MRKTWILNVISATLLLFCLLCLAVLPCYAVAAPSLPEPPDTSGAKAVYLYNFESDQSILEKNLTERLAPASTVKIASGLVSIGALSNRLDETVTVQADMLSSVGGTKLGLKAGDMLSVRDLLYASICGGYNDATEVLACVVSGSQEAFVRRLNECLAEWGCHNTYYTNATGMDDAGMYTTLSDVTVLAKRAIEDSLYMTVSSAISYSFVLKNRDENLLVYNRNALISPYYYQGCQSKYAKGLIAGMTDRGGYCVATYAEYNGSRYLCIVMGAGGASGSIPSSFSIAYALLQHAFLNCAYTPIAYAGDRMCDMTVRLALPNSKEGAATVPCVLKEDLYALLPEDIEAEDLSFRPYLHRNTWDAPIAKGSVVGGTDVYYGDTWLCHAKLVVAEDVERNSMLATLAWMRAEILSRRTLVSLISFSAMCGVYFLVIWNRRRQPLVPRRSEPANAQKTPKRPRP